MSVTRALVAIGAAVAVSCWLVVSGWRQPRPALVDVVRRLHAPTSTDVPLVGHHRSSWSRWWGSRPLLARFADRWSPSLRLLGRPFDEHVGQLAAISIAGFLLPSTVVIVLRSAGLASLSATVPAAVSVVLAVAAPALLHADTMSRADEVRIDVRYQLSAYLDMVTMLLAGNAGHEGALQQAADAGDGLLFRQLRRRMREVGATGQSLVRALSLVATDFALVELEQVAATTELSAAQGAPVARTLAAKCATLRTTIVAEQEASARIRTDKVTPPLVGMALLFMALIIYPALDLN